MDKSNDFIDYSVRLTKKEECILSKAVIKVVDSILKREKDPVKRRLLLYTISTSARFQAIMHICKKGYSYNYEKSKK